MPQDPALVGKPYIDVDEWRDEPRRHRYVHGGFENTHTLFSFYFPEKEQYRGRFFQYLEGGAGGHENLIAGQRWMFRMAYDDLGGYLVESNQGHHPNEGTGFANNWELFDASAESAIFSRSIAEEMYGEEPHHGYVWGGSGGGSRSIYCIENRPDVYAGGCPHVIWVSALGSTWGPIGQVWLQAREKLDEIIDATEPGGSGDPFATLDANQREALAALYRYGYPRGAESQIWAFSPWMWGLAGLRQMDAGYFHDFWNTPGYIGHDQSGKVAARRFDITATVTEVVTGAEGLTDIAVLAETAGAARPMNVGVKVDVTDDPDKLFGAVMTVLTGEAKGREIVISQVTGTMVSTSGEFEPKLFEGVAVGDQVRFHNDDFIAWCYHFMYALPLDALMETNELGEKTLLPGHEGLRAYAVDDKPLYPQRVPMYAAPAPEDGENSGPNRQTGRIPGKMIHVNATHDAQCWPNGCAAYGERVRSTMGDEADDHYRLWWVENAPHGAPQMLGPALTNIKDPNLWRARLVDYDGVTAQALRDVVAWVEDGIAAPPTTGFTMTTDGGIKLAETVKERQSVQPIASATANGAVRAEVKVGEPVTLVGTGEMAPGMGTIVTAEWDTKGTGPFERFDVDGSQEKVTVETTTTYDTPGTYFASFRVGSHRDGLAGNPPYPRNNARVRIVVT
jgi:hypothetical protein